MSSERITGLDITIAMVERLAPAAQDELQDLLETVGPQIADQQRLLAPSATGKLRASISWQAALGRLIVGLISKGSRMDAYYGRFVHFGRHGQKVLVQRRKRVNGQLRTVRRRKRVEDIVSTYTLEVRPRAPRPFIVISPTMEKTVDNALSNFWSRVLSSSGNSVH